MRRWKRVEAADGPRFVSVLEHQEVTLLRTMATSMQEMLDDRQSAAPSDPLEQLTGIRTGNASAPDDATMQRLLPDFLRDEAGGQDGEGRDGGGQAGANSALRSMHEPEIIDAKIAAAHHLLETLPEDGGPVELTEADAEAWVAAVNDLRLALGTMLGIGPQGPERLPESHPMAAHLDVYHWLTVLQEEVVLGLMGKPIR